MIRAKMPPITIKYAFAKVFRWSCLSVAQIISMTKPTIGKHTRINVIIQSFNDICFSVCIVLTPTPFLIMVTFYPTIVYVTRLQVILEIVENSGYTSPRCLIHFPFCSLNGSKLTIETFDTRTFCPSFNCTRLLEFINPSAINSNRRGSFPSSKICTKPYPFGMLIV